MDTNPSKTIMDTGYDDNQTIVMIPADQPSTWTIHSLAPESTVQVSLRAHNNIGFSEESSVLVMTPAGNSPDASYTHTPHNTHHVSVTSSPVSVLTLTQTYSSSSFSHHSAITIVAFIILSGIFVDFVIFKTYHKGEDILLFMILPFLSAK